ncbi:MAG: hypothetical protein KKD46_05150 [Euryarchaeota archaeon]|nr:hypothetical protein [Euryarchaeota archaeon]MBU4340285.1 hypothetical protein [Euryarchaeota archaeon]MBU4453572.1 hypothetical protein [Euryarchaeota archaeon]MCG2737053.1 hypothetical protein [Candidatus Methanoperedenaceae archaeon]
MFKSKHPILLLNEIKWRFDLNRCKVYYIHRGAPGDVRMIEGSIIRIEYDSQMIFERKRRS